MESHSSPSGHNKKLSCFVLITVDVFIPSLLIPSSITTSSDATAVITGLYDLVAAEVKAAASVCPAAESFVFLQPCCLPREVPDGLNARGELL